MGMLQFLKISYILVGILLLPLSLEGKDALEQKSPLVASHNSSKKGTAQNVVVNSGSGDPTIVAPLKKEKQLENTNKVTQNDVLKANVSKTTEKVSEGSSNVGVWKEGIDSKQVKNKDKEIGNTGGSKGVDSNQPPTKDGVKESSSWMKVKANTRDDEECDPSNMCVDEAKNLTACLRVTGNDSPDLSLQIWNKGTKPFAISITAPPFVQLEETKVQLQPKEDKKVKVSIAYEGIDSLIFLTTEDTRCTLDFRDLVPRDLTQETRYFSFKLQHLKNLTKTHLIIFLILTSFLVFGCALMYFGLHKKLILGNGYRALEMELPVTVVPKTVTKETNDGWDNSWNDSWDNENAAPITPTLPVTPNLSARGLASRRLPKEAWKD